ncbi:MAG: hypothetical protein HKN24_05045 [Acidimicrobiales bacterium]|nr:hypothetical protein [Acidimicrobiales bacterium]
MSAVSAARAADSFSRASELARRLRRRKALHACLGEAAHQDWHRFAATNGVSLNAVLESLAIELNRDDAPNGTVDLAVIIDRSRAIDLLRDRG